MLTARVPKQIIDAIEEYRKREQLEFKQEALIGLLKVAFDSLGITCLVDVSDFAKTKDAERKEQPEKPEVEEAKQEDAIPQRIACPKTGRLGEWSRCYSCFQKKPKDFEGCKAIPQQWRETISPSSEEDEELDLEEAPKEETAKTEASTPTQPIEKVEIEKEDETASTEHTEKTKKSRDLTNYLAKEN